MQGKHLFLRCRNEQNHAGTWTAAITEDILSSRDVREQIEHRCNLNESFAQEYMSGPAQNSVLRLYHPMQGVTVITRTFWTTDRLTEALGRKGAYSVSCILTEQDAERFNENYSGAFDLSNFETYDELLNRAIGGRVTLGQTPNLFAAVQESPRFDVFRLLGMTVEMFSTLMEGVYSAMLNNRHFVVILPQDLRDKWVQFGDNTAELFAEAVLALLPPKARGVFGFVSHWGSRLDDRMIDDMHLVFAHVNSLETYRAMSMESIGVLNLDTKVYFISNPAVAPTYFRFLWNNLSDYHRILSFWSYATIYFNQLLINLPSSAAAMECVFMFYQRDHGIAPHDITDRALFLSAARIFAGAGSAVPKIEFFFQKEITQMLTLPKLDPELEQAVLLIATTDRRPTEHQSAEYQLLIKQILSGHAQRETIEQMGKEPLRKARNADARFVQVLQEIQPGDDTLVLERLFGFLSVLMKNIAPARNAHIALYQELLSLLLRWSEQLILTDSSSYMMSICSFAEDYLRYDGTDLALNKLIYELLFKYENAGQNEGFQAERILKCEEADLYSKDRTQNRANRLSSFAQSFLSNIPFICSFGAEKAKVIYPRLYRLTCASDDNIFELAIQSYELELTAVLNQYGGNAFFQEFISIQKGSFQEIIQSPETWAANDVARALERIEQINLMNVRTYLPQTDEEYALILQQLKGRESFPSIAFQYLERMRASEQLSFCKKYSRDLPLETLYGVAVLAGNTDVINAVRPLMNSNMDCLCEILNATSTYKQSPELLAARFLGWYRGELSAHLEKAIRFEASSVEKIKILSAEAQKLHKIDCPPESQKLIHTALGELYKTAGTIIERMDGTEFLYQEPTTILATLEFLESDPSMRSTSAVKTIHLFRDIDACHKDIDQNQLPPFYVLARNLDVICYEHCMINDSKGLFEKSAISYRLEWWAKRYRSSIEPSREKFLFRTDALFCSIMRTNVPGGIMMEYKLTDYEYDDSASKVKAEIILNHLDALYNPPDNKLINLVSTYLFDELKHIFNDNPEVYRERESLLGDHKRLLSWEQFRSFWDQLHSPSDERSLFPAVIENAWKTPKFWLIAIPLSCLISFLVFGLLVFLTTVGPFWLVFLVVVLLLATGCTVLSLEMRRYARIIENNRASSSLVFMGDTGTAPELQQTDRTEN